MKRFRVEPGSKVDLRRFKPDSTKGFKGGKKEAEKLIPDLCRRLDAVQEAMWAEHKHKVLIILQGIDTSGKDGTIRHVFQNVNPLGVRAVGFRVPTEEERDHDFLWRVHSKVPGAGEMVIFNRSHYEQLLPVRVLKLEPPEVWHRHFDQINDFERLLAETGTTVLKFFLHISKAEQKRRLQERLDDPAKQWKFRKGDLVDRAHWEEYMKAYEDILNRTSQKWAPWYVVPSDKKWFRNLLVATVLVETMEDLGIKSPQAEEDLKGIVID
jgi:PPK2 family polyphosphate:nucleotide phosphotransferase